MFRTVFSQVQSDQTQPDTRVFVIFNVPPKLYGGKSERTPMPDNNSFFGTVYDALFSQPKVDYQKLQQQMYQGALSGSNPVVTDQLPGNWFDNVVSKQATSMLPGKAVQVPDVYENMPKAGNFDSPKYEEITGNFPRGTYGGGRHRISSRDPLTDLIMRNTIDRY